MEALFALNKPVIVLDHMRDADHGKSGFPAARGNFAECEGTYVSAEGRAQRGFPAVPLPGEAAPGWIWLRDIAAAIGHPCHWQNFDA